MLTTRHIVAMNLADAHQAALRSDAYGVGLYVGTALQTSHQISDRDKTFKQTLYCIRHLKTILERNTRPSP